MRIRYKRVRFKNFLSYGNTWTEIDLESYRSTLIRGPNGVGKTTMMAAIIFALFNKPYGDVNKPDLINDLTGKDCLVELEFEGGGHTYKVARGIKPNIFDVYQDGELINQNADPKTYQETLERQIIRCNFKSFCQVGILGSTSYVPFMQLPLPKRREIIEDLLDLTNFPVMQSILKGKMTDIDSGMSDITRLIQIREEKIKVLEKSSTAIKKTNDDMIKLFETERKGYEDGIVESEKRIATLREIIADIDIDRAGLEKIASKITDLQTMHAKFAAKIKGEEQEISFLTRHEDCPTCKQVIDADFKTSMIDTKTRNVEKNRQLFSEIIEQLNKRIEQRKVIDAKFNEVVKHQSQIGVEESRIKDWKKRINTIDQNIANLRTRIEEVDMGEIDAIRDEIVRLRANYEEMNVDKTHHKAAHAMLPLIRAQVVKKFVPIFNEQIKKYLALLQFPIKFEIDENFEETMHIRGRTGKNYGSLSEGQKFRVDVALMFAWRAVARIRSSVDSSILLLDEILDGSLDEDGREQFMDIVSNMTDSNIFIISHNGNEGFEDKFDRVLDVSMRGNFSQVKEAA